MRLSRKPSINILYILVLWYMFYETRNDILAL